MVEYTRKLFEEHEYTTKLSVALTYAFLAAIAMNFFWRPGNIYAGGLSGAAQLLATVLERWTPIRLSIPLLLFLLNSPMFILAWRKIGPKFTIFTFITVAATSIIMKLIPVTVLTDDPIICAIFGGATSGFGVGFALKNGISSGGLDIISLTIRKTTGRSVGSINLIFNVVIVFAAGFLFGWPYAFYTVLSIFVSAKMMDLVYTKQQKMQVMIVTEHPDNVIKCIQGRMRRGITIVHDVEGAYNHREKTILFTVISRYEMYDLEFAMKEADPKAFVSISDSVKILGKFYDPGMD